MAARLQHAGGVRLAELVGKPVGGGVGGVARPGHVEATEQIGIDGKFLNHVQNFARKLAARP